MTWEVKVQISAILFDSLYIRQKIRNVLDKKPMINSNSAENFHNKINSVENYLKRIVVSVFLNVTMKADVLL